jgi:UDP:flavonoid glycosyltransferase YjiC (YdhE family)
MKKAMDPRQGPEFVFRHVVFPALRQTTEDIAKAAEGGDLLVSHVLTFGTRLIAERNGIPWLSTTLAPVAFLSAYDPPVLPKAPWLRWLRWLGPGFHGALIGLLKWSIRDWAEPVHTLRREWGLPPLRQPIFDDSHSPHGALALFSRLLGEPQRDWPPRVIQTGFPFYDQDGAMEPALQAFLDAGEAPVVFTLGSAAVMNPGEFFSHSVEAARKLGVRAVLVTGPEAHHRPQSLPSGLLAVDYAPFSALFARARVVVHQGGVGTTGQALRSGHPMLVVPVSHDQPDNAHRVGRRGLARVLPITRYTAQRAYAELAPLLRDPAYAEKAALVGQQIRAENGVETACDVIETVLQRQPLSVR